MFCTGGIPDARVQNEPPSSLVYTPGSAAPATATTRSEGDSTTTDSIPPMFSLLSPVPPPSWVQLGSAPCAASNKPADVAAYMFEPLATTWYTLCAPVMSVSPVIACDHGPTPVGAWNTPPLLPVATPPPSLEASTDPVAVKSSERIQEWSVSDGVGAHWVQTSPAASADEAQIASAAPAPASKRRSRRMAGERRCASPACQCQSGVRVVSRRSHSYRPAPTRSALITPPARMITAST
jgi:hypothetical protein